MKKIPLMPAIAGDIVGSVYERRGTRIKTEDFPLFSKGCHPTDDTMMTLAVASALKSVYHGPSTSDKDVKESVIREMRQMGNRYPKAGYGNAFSQWLIYPYPYGSWGNGSAMRVSAVGWLAESTDEVLRLAKLTAEVSHNTDEGIAGAQAVALAVYMARTGKDKEAIRQVIEENFGYDLHRSVDEIRPGYEFNASCPGSVPEAIIAFLDSASYEDAVRKAVSLGGDADTQACIAGAIAGAYYGMPKGIEDEAFGYLDGYCQNMVSTAFRVL